MTELVEWAVVLGIPALAALGLWLMWIRMDR